MTTETDAFDAAEALEADVAGLPDFRRMPVPDAIRWLAEHGEPADPRPDIDTASLVRRFPHLAGVTTADEVVEGAHGRVPVRVYRDARATPSGRALVWVHGGAFIGGNLDMPESNWVARELAARGIPVVSVDYAKCLGDVHYPVPSDDVLAAWRHVRDAAEELLGVPPEQVALGGASAGGTLTAGRGHTAARRGGAAAGRTRARLPARAPQWACGVGRARPVVAARAAVAELRGLDRGAHGPAGVRRPRGRARIPAHADRGVRRRRPAPVGRGVRRDADRSRRRRRCSTSRRTPATATSTSRATRPPCARSRPSPSGSRRDIRAPMTDRVRSLHQPGARGRPPRPRGHQGRRRVLADLLVVRVGAGAAAVPVDRPRQLDLRGLGPAPSRSATRSRSTSPSTTAGSSSTSRSSRRRGRR